MNHRKRNAGFTLVELMVVVVIASILAMIAVPGYRASVIKSRRVDAKVVLNDTAQRLERCYTQFGAYNAAGCAIQDEEVIDSPEGHYSVTVTVPDAGSYSLLAAPQGAQVDDELCGELGLTSTGIRSETGTSDLDHCW